MPVSPIVQVGFPLTPSVFPRSELLQSVHNCHTSRRFRAVFAVASTIWLPIALPDRTCFAFSTIRKTIVLRRVARFLPFDPLRPYQIVHVAPFHLPFRSVIARPAQVISSPVLVPARFARSRPAAVLVRPSAHPRTKTRLDEPASPVKMRPGRAAVVRSVLSFIPNSSISLSLPPYTRFSFSVDKLTQTIPDPPACPVFVATRPIPACFFR